MSAIVSGAESLRGLRRAFRQGQGARGLGAVVLALALAAASSARADTRIADIREGTNISIALSPAAPVLVTDLLGRLWQLPANGGGAEPLTPDDEAARYPRFGPDGRSIVYQRLVDGQWDLWLVDLETHERRALLASAFNERQPDFSGDGRSVVFSSDRTGHYCLWSIDVASGVLTQLTEEPGDASFPTVSGFGEIAYVKRDGGTFALRVLTAQGVATELATSSDEILAPSWRPGGGVIVYNERDLYRRSELKLMVVTGGDHVLKTLTTGEDVFATRVAWISPSEYLYTADGHIWRRGIAQISRTAVPMFAAVTVATSDASGSSGASGASGASAASSASSASTLPEQGPLDAPGPHPALGIADRSESADGRTEVFTALGDLWLARARNAPLRLTNDAFVDIDPSVAPDGRFAVFASDRGGRLGLWRIDLPGGALTALASGPGKAYRPAVSPDGRRVAFLETDGFGPWAAASLRILDLSGAGTARTLAAELAAPDRPRWSAGGARLSLEQRAPGGSLLLEIDAATGRRRVPATASREAEGPKAEGPEAEGRDAEGREAARLQWTAPGSDEPYVVQVGRLFDGVRTDYQRHVDIHIRGQRIVAIAPRNMLPLPDKVIDARDATVIPGLIDVHVHESSLMGERLGRIWLASGVTTVGEVSADLPAALERAEAWASGRRLGPRVVVSAESDRVLPLPAPESILSPIPVRRYAALPIAQTLRPYDLVGASATAGSTAPAPWVPALAADERIGDGLFRLRTSPLNRSYQDVLSTIVESQAVVTSNLAAMLGPSAAPAAWKRLVESPLFRRLYRDAERARWLDRPETSAPVRALEENIARLVRAGGRVAAGSEAPAVPYGLGVHIELALLADAGLPIDQVLRIATAQNASALGLADQLGTLEPGKLADFVVIDGNPWRTSATPRELRPSLKAECGSTSNDCSSSSPDLDSITAFALQKLRRVAKQAVILHCS
jgi:Tol biopolymer transport system component